MAKPQELIYAVVGAGDFAAEKVRNARKVADRKNTQKLYKDFVKRGRSVWTKVRRSGPTKQAIAQTKTARTQVKAAATSVTKAFRADAKAAKSAASKTTSGSRSAKAS
jgi:hypothetical protein